MATNVLPTYNGRRFNITLDAGYCFAMCVDMAKVLLTFQRQGKSMRLPAQDNLSPGKWFIMQSAYEINSRLNDKTLIEGQGLEVASSIPATPFTDFEEVASAITAIAGTTVFGIMGDGGHELMWHRDDANSIWLYLDPNYGLYKFDGFGEAAAYIASALNSNYPDLDEKYDAFNLRLT
jgi:hypothetical protein